MPRPLVVLDLAAGRATLGRTVVVVRVRAGGVLEYGGRVLRPLRFAERWRLAETAASGPAGSLAASVLAAASSPGASGLATAGSGDEQIARALALHLAGARPDRAVPAYGAQLGALVGTGWTARDVLDADADLVDLLTVEEDPGEPLQGGWTSIVLTHGDEANDAAHGAADGAAGNAADGAGLTPDELLRLLEQNLLGRLVPDRAGGPTDAGPGTRRAEGPAHSVPTAPEWAAPTSAASAAAAAGGRPSTMTVPEEHRTGAAHDPALPGLTSAPGTAGHPRPIRADWPASATWAVPPAVPPGVPVTSDPAAWSVATTSPLHVPPAGVLPTAVPPGPPSARRATQPDASPAPIVLQDDVTAGRVERLAFPPASRPDPFDVADEMAALLDEESDLRGLRR